MFRLEPAVERGSFGDKNIDVIIYSRKETERLYLPANRFRRAGIVVPGVHYDTPGWKGDLLLEEKMRKKENPIGLPADYRAYGNMLNKAGRKGANLIYSDESSCSRENFSGRVSFYRLPQESFNDILKWYENNMVDTPVKRLPK
ncbi:MAG: hypothetical protein ACQEP1_03335 [Nanobdellota archaeon]